MNTTPTLASLIATIGTEALVEYSARAPAATSYNAAAKWINRMFMAELARRSGEAPRDVGPLLLDTSERAASLEWLDACANHTADASMRLGNADLLRLAALFDHLHRALEAAPAVAIH